MPIIEIIGAILGSSVLTALASNWISRKKVQADATDVIVKSILDWATQLTKRIDKLEQELVIKDSLILELQIKVAKLEKNGNK